MCALNFKKTTFYWILLMQGKGTCQKIHEIIDPMKTINSHSDTLKSYNLENWRSETTNNPQPTNNVDTRDPIGSKNKQ